MNENVLNNSNNADQIKYKYYERISVYLGNKVNWNLLI